MTIKLSKQYTYYDDQTFEAVHAFVYKDGTVKERRENRFDYENRLAKVRLQSKGRVSKFEGYGNLYTL
jgi:hypothetical protein